VPRRTGPPFGLSIRAAPAVAATGSRRRIDADDRDSDIVNAITLQTFVALPSP
jgi:hypothetical protein